MHIHPVGADMDAPLRVYRSRITYALCNIVASRRLPPVNHRQELDASPQAVFDKRCARSRAARSTANSHVNSCTALDISDHPKSRLTARRASHSRGNLVFLNTSSHIVNPVWFFSVALVARD